MQGLQALLLTTLSLEGGGGGATIHQVFRWYAHVVFLHGAELGAVGDMRCI